MSRLIDATELNGYEFGLISPYAQALFHSTIKSAPTVKAIPLGRIKKAREEISKKIGEPVCGEYIKQGHDWGLKEALTIIDKLIAESEES